MSKAASKPGCCDMFMKSLGSALTHSIALIAQHCLLNLGELLLNPVC